MDYKFPSGGTLNPDADIEITPNIAPAMISQALT